MKLPSRYKTKTVADMTVGECAWVTPWTMIVDQYDEECFINLAATPGDKGGTVSMQICRNPLGFDVVLSADMTYSPRVIEDYANLAPVTSLKERV